MGKCVKRKFRTELDAKIALFKAEGRRAKNNARRREVRYYRCPECGSIRLTSRL